jgi:hypothetical protein
MTLTAQIIRIVLRYLAGFLVAKGVIDASTGDALTSDETLAIGIETGIGLAIGGLTEWRFAKSVRAER